MRQRIRALVMVGPALALVAGTACSSKTKSSSPSTTPGESTTAAAGGSQSGGGKAISIKSFAFQPATIQAKVGDTITVTNNDNTPHTVTSDDETTFDTKEFATGSKTIVLTKAGTFMYHCHVHGFMPHGTIQVSG